MYYDKAVAMQVKSSVDNNPQDMLGYAKCCARLNAYDRANQLYLNAIRFDNGKDNFFNMHLTVQLDPSNYK